MAFKTILLEQRGPVALITLNRPDHRNAVTVELCREVREAFLATMNDPAVRAFVITGAGKSFCAGADLNMPEDYDGNVPLTPYNMFLQANLHIHSAISIIARTPKPVISAVNGGAAGIGMSLAISADLVYAARSAKFNWAYTQRAFVPDGGSTVHLSQRIGWPKAMEIAFTGRILSADEALGLGLVNDVFDDAGFLDQTMHLAEKIAHGPTWSYGQTKLLLREAYLRSLETQAEIENRLIAESSLKEDFMEGIVSFLEKRPPSFKGR